MMDQELASHNTLRLQHRARAALIAKQADQSTKLVYESQLKTKLERHQVVSAAPLDRKSQLLIVGVAGTQDDHLDAIVSFPMIMSKVNLAGSQARPQTKSSVRKPDSQNQSRRKISQAPFFQVFDTPIHQSYKATQLQIQQPSQQQPPHTVKKTTTQKLQIDQLKTHQLKPLHMSSQYQQAPQAAIYHTSELSPKQYYSDHQHAITTNKLQGKTQMAVTGISVHCSSLQHPQPQILRKESQLQVQKCQDAAYSVMVIPQSQIVFESKKPAQIMALAVEDCEEDDGLVDDVITTTEGGHSTSDNELTLHSFKYNHRQDSGACLVNDSDRDSDAGSQNNRASLVGVSQPIDSAKKQKVDDEEIDDISEHSSDEIDSDSEDDVQQKQIKRLNKRKKRKIEAIRKAQQAAENQKKKEVKVEIVKHKAAPLDLKKKTSNETATQKQKDKTKPSQDQDKKKQKAPETVKKQVQPEESPKKKKKEKQKTEKTISAALAHAAPKNLEEQKEIFFMSDCTYNPQFEYDNFESTQRLLGNYKEPSDALLMISEQIMESFLRQFGSESAYLETEGDLVTQEETEKLFQDYIDELEFTETLTLNFQARQVAPTSVTHDPKTGKSRVNIRLPCEYRRGRIMGVIDHEIGTHFLRRNNEKFQVWAQKRNKYDVKNCMRTEEGFASTNQMVRCALEGGHPFLYRSALNYYMAYKASKMGFVELFNDIQKYIDCKQSRWKYVMRVKRGVMDTSEPGGYYKDQVYLEGTVTILRERKTLDFYGLCCGKISLEDMKRLGKMNKLKKEQIKIPPFMRDMDKYMQALDIIAHVNHIDEYNEVLRLKEAELGVSLFQRVNLPTLATGDDGSEQAISDESDLD